MLPPIMFLMCSLDVTVSPTFAASPIVVLLVKVTTVSRHVARIFFWGVQDPKVDLLDVIPYEKI